MAKVSGCGNGSGADAWPPWLQGSRRHLDGLLERGHLPQALLIHGVPGTGRRRLALWLAARLLRLPEEALVRFASDAGGDDESGEPGLGHPDLMQVRPPPDKAAIHVESVRELIAFLQLTSHQGGRRVALLWPAEAMTPAAANALLKTLEEPPAAGSIVLVTALPARLPPTILSRCQRLRVPLPERALALAWLAAAGGAGDWGAVLDFAGGAPLAALDWSRAGLERQLADYASDLEQLRRRHTTPVAVARRWIGGDATLALRWLYLHAAAGLTAALADAGRGSGAGRLQNPAKPTNMPLQRLRDAEELRRHEVRGLATEVQLAAVLQRWYGDSPTGDGKH